MCCGKKKSPILREDLLIVDQKEIASEIFALDIKGKMVSEMRAGQFLHIRVPDDTKLLRRPISIASIDLAKGIARLIYRVEGEGTRIFSQLKTGSFLDCMGPQGNGFKLDSLNREDSALLIGGGIGVPPLYELAKVLYQKGVRVTAVLGFATQSAVILEEELKNYANVLVATDDGTYGVKGTVATILQTLSDDFAAVYACGAPGMLSYINEQFQDHPHAYLSLESRMACGMGACYACVVPLAHQTEESKRVCVDGPVFPTGSLML